MGLGDLNTVDHALPWIKGVGYQLINSRPSETGRLQYLSDAPNIGVDQSPPHMLQISAGDPQLRGEIPNLTDLLPS